MATKLLETCKKSVLSVKEALKNSKFNILFKRPHVPIKSIVKIVNEIISGVEY